jgi:hypothetical protein
MNEHNYDCHKYDCMYGSVAAERKDPMTVGQYFQQLLSKPIEPMKEYNVEDADLLAKTQHVRAKSEKIIELIAKAGITPAQIREWDEAQIAKFCAQATENAKDEVAIPITEFSF